MSASSSIRWPVWARLVIITGMSALLWAVIITGIAAVRVLS